MLLSALGEGYSERPTTGNLTQVIYTEGYFIYLEITTTSLIIQN